MYDPRQNPPQPTAEHLARMVAALRWLGEHVPRLADRVEAAGAQLPDDLLAELAVLAVRFRRAGELALWAAVPAIAPQVVGVFMPGFDASHLGGLAVDHALVATLRLVQNEAARLERQVVEARAAETSGCGGVPMTVLIELLEGAFGARWHLERPIPGWPPVGQQPAPPAEAAKFDVDVPAAHLQRRGHS